MNNGCPILHFLFTSDVWNPFRSVPFEYNRSTRWLGWRFRLEGTGIGNLAESSPNILSEPIPMPISKSIPSQCSRSHRGL